MSILFWNINGNFAYKVTDSSFIHLISKRDIVIFIETKLRKTDHMDLSCFGFHTLFRSDRRSGSGGVLIAIRKWLQPHVTIERCEFSKDLVLVNVLGRFVVGGIYIPPRGSSRFTDFDRFQYLEECLEDVASKGLPYILVGDYNARFGCGTQRFFCPETNTANEYTISNSDKTVNRSGRELLEVCNRTASRILTGSLWNHNSTCFRHNGCSVVDTGICSVSMIEHLCDGKILSSTLSDHAPISFNLMVSRTETLVPRTSSRHVLPSSILRRMLNSPEDLNRFHVNLLDSSEIIELISDANRIFLSDKEVTKTEISSYMSKVYDTVSRTLSDLFPSNTNKKSKSMNRKDCPYVVHYTQQCIDARIAFYRAQRVFIRNNSDTNYRILYSRRMKKQSLERRCKRFAEKQFLSRVFRQPNPQSLWQQVRLKAHDTYNGPIGVEDYTNFLEAIADGKFCYDKNLSEQSMKSMNALCLMSNIPKSDLLTLLHDFPIESVLAPKLNKAVGLDGWSGELVRCLYPILASIIPHVFLACLRSGVTPRQWDADIKVPLSKPGKPLDKPNSLRPITLVNVLMKQYEAWLIFLLEKYCTTSEHQAGFKKGYSCTGRLFLLRGMLEQQLCHNKSVYAIFIDFSSFFDTIRGEILSSLLEQFMVCSGMSELVF